MQKALQEFGLTEGESKAYLALLKLGVSSVGPIVKKSGVSYSKIYEVLGRLIEKGFVSFIIKEKTKHFQAVNPSKLNNYIEREEQRIELQKKALKELIPKLNLLGDQNEEQKAEIFIGLKGLKTAYELLLAGNSKNQILRFFYVHDEKYSEKANEFYEIEFMHYKKLGIKLRGICTNNLKNSRFFNKPPKFVDLRFVEFPLPSTIDLFNGKVLIVAWREKPYAYLISSSEIYENYLRYFEEVWKSSKPNLY